MVRVFPRPRRRRQQPPSLSAPRLDGTCYLLTLSPPLRRTRASRPCPRPSFRASTTWAAASRSWRSRSMSWLHRVAMAARPSLLRRQAAAREPEALANETSGLISTHSRLTIASRHCAADCARDGGCRRCTALLGAARSSALLGYFTRAEAAEPSRETAVRATFECRFLFLCSPSPQKREGIHTRV